MIEKRREYGGGVRKDATPEEIGDEADYRQGYLLGFWDVLTRATLVLDAAYSRAFVDGYHAGQRYARRDV